MATFNIDFRKQIPANNFWKSYLEKLGCLDMSSIECLPEFMVISPGKTGTTWLSMNLNCHPEIFIPEAKEIRYFCTQWRRHDINWYLRHFQEGINLAKGEISPSYALLPLMNIKLIRLLMPNLKLVFLMRDPISRAWSQAKHNHKYNECNFSCYEGDSNSVSERKFIENFVHEWPFFLGDYLGTLKRWLSFFPKEQFFIGFYESIKDDPRGLLVNIFNYLGVKDDVIWSEFPTSEIFFKGVEGGTSDNLKRCLRSIYRNRTKELAIFLKEHFNVEIPEEWNNTLTGDEISNPLIVEECYKGYNIFLHDGRFYAISQDIKNIDIAVSNVKESQESSKCFIGNSLCEAKYLVSQFFRNALPKQGTDFEDYYLRKVLDEIFEYICNCE